jgi:hypothetical protein
MHADLHDMAPDRRDDRRDRRWADHHVGIGADCQQALKSKGTLIQRSARLFAARIRAIFRRGCKGQSDLLIARKIPALTE